MTVTALLLLAMALGDPLARLQARVPVAPVEFSTVREWAGVYLTPGGLSGSELYLFPDGGYLYCEWADIEPRTVYDKGHWSVAGASIRLRSDQEITWDPQIDRDLVAVRRRQHPEEVLLVGTGRPLEFVETYGARDTSGTLAVVALARRRQVKDADAAALWAALMKESWRPDYPRSQSRRH
jgi:hypothetical protein